MYYGIDGYQFVKPRHKRDVVVITFLYICAAATIFGAVVLGSLISPESSAADETAAEQPDIEQTAQWFANQDRQAERVLRAVAAGNRSTLAGEQRTEAEKLAAVADYALLIIDQQHEHCVHLFHLTFIAASRQDSDPRSNLSQLINKLPVGDNNVAECRKLSANSG